MRSRFLLSPEILDRTCLYLGTGVFIFTVLLTLGSIGAALTGNVAQLERSRLINQSYATLSICGETLAAVGFLAGTFALLRKRQISLGLAIGLALNLMGLILFLPATLALILNGFWGLLDYLLN